MTMAEGWVCPVCRRGVAPGEKSCDHGGEMRAIQPRALPSSVPNMQPIDWTRTNWSPVVIPQIVTGGCSVSADESQLLWNGRIQ